MDVYSLIVFILIDQLSLISGINLSIKILQAGAWPLGPTQVTSGFAVPQEFEKPIRLFESFYHVNFSGRKLTWLNHLCHGELKISFADRNYMVTMQTYQMAILLLFESTDSLHYKEIQDSLQLNKDMLQKHILSLVESKLLLSDTEVFLINYSQDFFIDLIFPGRRREFEVVIEQELYQQTN